MSNSRADGTGAPGRLSVGTRPFGDESLPGFIMRLAERAHFPTAGDLAGMAGLRQPTSAMSHDDIGPLADLIGADIGTLEQLVYRPTGRQSHFRFLGCALHLDLFRVGSRRFCPRCLAEKPYHRTLWDFVPMTACPDHGVRLVSKCPECSRPLGVQGAGVTRCRCGADFRSVHPEVVGDGEVEANRALRDLVTLAAVPWLSPVLMAADRSDLLWATMRLGMFFTDWKRKGQPDALLAAGPDAAAPVIIAATRVCQDWPVSLRGYLAERVHAPKEDTGRRYGAQHALGRQLYFWLSTMDSGPLKDAIAAEASVVMSEDPNLLYRTHRSTLIAKPEDKELITIKEASGMLGARWSRVTKLMAAGVVAGTVSEGSGVPVLIRREEIEALAREEAGSVDLKAAARALGISKPRTRSLVEAGVLTPFRGTAAGWATWAIPIEQIVELLEKASVVRRTATTKLGRMLGFNSTAECLRRRGVEFPAFVSMVVDGKIPVAMLDQDDIGFHRLCFDKKYVNEMCRELEGGDTLTIQAVALRLKLNWVVVAHLVERGLLIAKDGFIRSEDLEQFQAAYVSGSVLAKEMKTSPRMASEILAERGIMPVVGPQVDGSRQNFYRRTDVDG
jgi:hypothetical protein